MRGVHHDYGLDGLLTYQIGRYPYLRRAMQGVSVFWLCLGPGQTGE